MKRANIAQITGLVFCDRDCGCGENNQLWWTTHNTPPEWMVANGWTTEEVEREIRRRAKEVSKWEV